MRALPRGKVTRTACDLKQRPRYSAAETTEVTRPSSGVKPRADIDLSSTGRNRQRGLLHRAILPISTFQVGEESESERADGEIWGPPVESTVEAV